MISTAGDAALSVADPSSNATGRLVNGSFALTQPVQAGVGGAYAPVGGSSSPTTIKTWSAPIVQRHGHDRLQAVDPRQRAAAHGHYSKTLTFTLSTTNP